VTAPAGGFPASLTTRHIRHRRERELGLGEAATE